MTAKRIISGPITILCNGTPAALITWHKAKDGYFSKYIEERIFIYVGVLTRMNSTYDSKQIYARIARTVSRRFLLFLILEGRREITPKIDVGFI